MSFRISCPSSKGHDEKSDSGLMADGDQRLFLGEAGLSCPGRHRAALGPDQTKAGVFRETCWVGMGVLRGSFKLKETLLGEKLLLVKLWMGAERVRALATEAMHSATLMAVTAAVTRSHQPARSRPHQDGVPWGAKPLWQAARATGPTISTGRLRSAPSGPARRGVGAAARWEQAKIPGHRSSEESGPWASMSPLSSN